MNGGVVRYRYAEPLADGGRVRYHYAPFEGRAFLDAYRTSRCALAANCDGCGGARVHMQTRGVVETLEANAIDHLRRQFEVHGRVGDAGGDGRVEAQLVVRLWRALGMRCKARLDVRELNCMLKLGDRVSQVGPGMLDGNSRTAAREAVTAEVGLVDEVARWDQRGRWTGSKGFLRPLKLSSRGGRSVPWYKPSSRSFGMLLVNSSRSRAYVCALARCGVLPRVVVYVSHGKDADEERGPAVDGFDNVTPVLKRLGTLDVETRRVESANINDSRVVRAVAQSGVELMVYSGPAGVKVKPALLRGGVELLHVHGGRLPAQRGSTTCYYSLLEEGCCWASAILLAQKLDHGAVVAQRRYGAPENRTQIDHGYDPMIRADLLARVLRRFVEDGMLSRLQQPIAGTMHYVMHPVLRHVVILAGSEDMNDRTASVHEATALDMQFAGVASAGNGMTA